MYFYWYLKPKPQQNIYKWYLVLPPNQPTKKDMYRKTTNLIRAAPGPGSSTGPARGADPAPGSWSPLPNQTQHPRPPRPPRPPHPGSLLSDH